MRTSAARAYSGSVVAVDVASNAVRAVEVSFNEVGDATVLKRGWAPLVHGAWSGLPGNRILFTEAIRNALAAASISTTSVVACFPRAMVTVRTLRLPPAAPEQMRGMVALEAQQHLLFSVDDVVLDHIAVEGAALSAAAPVDDLTTVLLVAARRSVAIDLAAMFSAAGLTLSRLSVSALALSENLRGPEASAIVDIKGGDIEVAVAHAGRLLFSRASSVPEASDLETVLADIVRSLSAFENEHRSTRLERVLVAGDFRGTSAESLVTSLAGLLEIPVSALPSEDAPYAAAIGLARQTLPTATAPINLVPPEIAARKAAILRRRRQRVSVTVGVAAAVLCGVAIQRSLTARSRQHAADVEANLDLADVSSRVTARTKTHAELVALDSALSTNLDRKHPMVDMLAALSQAAPKSASVWLTQLTLDRAGGITLRGDSKDETAATDYVLRLQESGRFRNVRLVYVGDALDTLQSSAPKAAPQVTAPAESPATQPPAPAPGIAPLPGMAPGAPASPPPGAPGMPAPSGGAPTMTAPSPAAPGQIAPGQPGPGGPQFPRGAPGGTGPFGMSPGSRGAFAPGGDPPRVVAIRPGPGAPLPGGPPAQPGTAGPGAGTPGAGAALPAGVVHAPTTPRVTPAPVRPAVQSALTSFVITCRINPASKALTAPLPQLAAVKTVTTGAAHPLKGRHATQ